MYVAIVTYHAPQTKYSRNIMTDSLVKITGFIGVGKAEEIYRVKQNGSEPPV
jgi:hypothetical protein